LIKTVASMPIKKSGRYHNPKGYWHALYLARSNVNSGVRILVTL
jgi:hypothetical protein